MPLNVGRLNTSVFLVSIAFVAAGSAQSPQASSSPVAQTTQPIAAAPTAAEVMRNRISKAKAFIAVRNYSAAVYELEQIRRETSDPSVHSVANVLLMNSFLELGDHKRAQALLNQLYNEQKTTKSNALTNYTTVAGQIVKSARSQAERYRSLGLSTTDRNLPTEAVADLDRMRETLELVFTQSKELSADRAKAPTAMGLLEEATNSRAMLARDDYDAARWRDAVADSREQLASSRSVIINAVDGTREPAAVPVRQQETAATTASNTPMTTGPVTLPASNQVQNQPAVNNAVADNKPVVPISQPANNQPKPSENAVATNNTNVPVVEKPKPAETNLAAQPERSRIIAGAQAAAEKEEGNKVKATSSSRPTGPLTVGSLLPYAAKQAPPAYPPAARQMRQTGVVKVEITIDEEGNVAEVQGASGPSLLQGSAKDAVRKWKFRPFMVDGQPVRASGFVSFNFSL